MHYVFDKWMERTHPNVLWCRYADDGLAHCKTEQEARVLLGLLKERFAQCGLELHPRRHRLSTAKMGSERTTIP
jgi:retron-type reverse transcriptase